LPVEDNDINDISNNEEGEGEEEEEEDNDNDNKDV